MYTKERDILCFLKIITIRIKGIVINYVTIVKHINLLPLTAAFNLKVKTYKITPFKDCTNRLLLLRLSMSVYLCMINCLVIISTFIVSFRIDD